MQKIKEQLLAHYPELKIREIDNGLKINVISIDTDMLYKLQNIIDLHLVDVLIKRSGTGLLIILTR